MSDQLKTKIALCLISVDKDYIIIILLKYLKKKLKKNYDH